MKNKKYIVYLDTKIKGALKQTINYFNQGIFDKNKVAIVFKRYAKINTFFEKELKHNNIRFDSFRIYKSMPDIDGKIMLYLFNAQSNCRLAANRKAKHIFVTHGESNKVASIKPIIRIYDHVIVAGDLGIDRYIENEIFYEDDIPRKRIIKMGDTFIGNSLFEYKNNNSILYAPTWEGGIKEENYSSLNANLDSFKIISNLLDNEVKIDTLYIQPHPNTGHRSKSFHSFLIKGISYLLEHNKNINIKIIGDYTNIFLTLLAITKNKLNIIKEKEKLNVIQAFVDISAMEVQLLNSNIPVQIFDVYDSDSIKFNDILKNNYTEYGIKFKNDNKNIRLKNINTEYKEYALSYEDEKLKNASKADRIDWLKEFINF